MYSQGGKKRYTYDTRSICVCRGVRVCVRVCVCVCVWSRDVIVPDKTLRIDEVSLPYVALVELLQQTIINLLQKIYNLSCNDAYNIWYNAQSSPDNRVVSIIENLLKKRKIHVLINRN